MFPRLHDGGAYTVTGVIEIHQYPERGAVRVLVVRLLSDFIASAPDTPASERETMAREIQRLRAEREAMARENERLRDEVRRLQKATAADPTPQPLARAAPP
jgi:cell division protein FtsB